MRAREIEWDIKNDQTYLELDVCKVGIFIEKLNNGIIYKSKDSTYTDAELKEYANKYQQMFSDVASKVINNSFNDYNELSLITDELDKINSSIKSQFDTAAGKDDKETRKKLETCLNGINSITDEVRASILPKNGFLPVETSLPGNNFKKIFILKKELESYQYAKNFDSLKSIKFVVVFSGNKESFEVKQEYSEFLMGEDAKQVPYNNGDMVRAIYNNEIYIDNLIKSGAFDEISKLF